MITIGIAISLAGNLNVLILAGSRTLFAMAENDDLPPALASIHARFRTPVVSVVLTTAVMLALTLSGTSHLSGHDQHAFAPGNVSGNVQRRARTAAARGDGAGAFSTKLGGVAIGIAGVALSAHGCSPTAPCGKRGTPASRWRSG